MALKTRRVAVAGVVGSVLILAPVRSAQAGPFLDWLLGRPVLTYPGQVAGAYAPAPATTVGYAAVPTTVHYAPAPATVAGYGSVPLAPAPAAAPGLPGWPSDWRFPIVPRTGSYAPAYVAPSAAPIAAVAPVVTAQYRQPVVSAPYGQPVVSAPYGQPVVSAPYGQPVVSAPYGQPVVSAPYGQPVVSAPYGQPVVVGYAPTYRTTWQRVPVTYYRPVTTTVAGYPAASAVPCNTYTWQAQRVPTLLNWPWQWRAPVAYPAPVTYSYAPVAPWVPSAPAAAPECCVGGALPAAPAGGTIVPGSPATGGVAPAGATMSEPAPLDSPSGAPSAADEAPSLLPGNFSPGISTGYAPSATGAGWRSEAAPAATPATIAPAAPAAPPAPAADAVRTQAERYSPYRVSPIPAPDVQSFDASREAPQAPPLLGRERTASHFTREAASVEKASWTPVSAPARGAQASPAAPTSPAAAPANKPLWKDGGWRNAK